MNAIGGSALRLQSGKRGFILAISSVFLTHDPWQAAILQPSPPTPPPPPQDDMCEAGQRCQHPSTRQIGSVIGAVRSSLYLSLIEGWGRGLNKACYDVNPHSY